MKRKAKIYYIALDDFWRKEEKLAWLRDNPIEKIEFERLEPDAKHNWINQTDNDFETLLPLVSREVKAGEKNEGSIFKLFTNGIVTNRDEWVYDFDKETLENKAKFLIGKFNNSVKKGEFTNEIKWSDSLKARLRKGESAGFDSNYVKDILFRPFLKKKYFSLKLFSDRLTENHYEIAGGSLNAKNKIINFLSIISSHPLATLASDCVTDLCLLKQGNGGTQGLSLYKYNLMTGEKLENITDWAVHQFQTHYGAMSEPLAVADGLTRQTRKIKDNGQHLNISVPNDDSIDNLQPSATADGSDRASGAHITKQDIFYYTYAVLHAPQYRKKYEQNLKREFPRLPFYDDFKQWRDWGEKLMDLHINYETQEPFALERIDLDVTAKRKIVQDSMFDLIGNKIIDEFVSKPQTKLRADKETGTITIDSITTLTGVPAIAWEYKLGNRSALEWILDQYKEKKPQDATIAERFNTYKFEDYKEQVIDLLKRVCNVSIKTVEIVNKME